MLSALAWLLPACGGGSSAPDPDPDPDPDPIPAVLSVVDVFPKNLEARSGSTIRFIAETSQQASSYLWDFGAGATPSTTSDFQPLVVLGAPGTYTATLTVCAAECAAPFQFTYTVKPNGSPSPDVHILQIAPTGLIGARGEDVTMTATIQGEVDLWFWNFGAGLQEPTSTEASPTIHLLRPGIYEGQLTARLSGGGEDSLAFAYEIGDGIDESPPIIEDSTISLPWICDNKTAALEADILSDFPVTYDWSFAAGISPRISANSIARIETPEVPGTYSASLRVSNQFGESTPLEWKITVPECPDTTLTLVEDAATPRGVRHVHRSVVGTVHRSFDAERVDSAAELLGTISGDEEEFFYAQPTATPADVLGYARRFGDWGTGDYGKVTLPTWTPPALPAPQTVLEVPTAHGGPQSTLALQGDKIVLIFKVPQNPQVQYWVSQTPDPQSAADWKMHTLPGGIITSGHIVTPLWSPGDGRPMVYCSFRDNENPASEALCVAESSDPQATSDWTQVPLAFHPGTHQAAVRDDGSLAIATFITSETWELRTSTSAHPLSESDFTSIVMDAPAHFVTGPPLDWKGHLQIPLWHPTAKLTQVVSATIGIPSTAGDLVMYQLPRPDDLPFSNLIGSWMLHNDQVLWIDSGSAPASNIIYWTDDPAPDAVDDWTMTAPIALFPNTFRNAPAVDGRWAILQEIDQKAFLWRALAMNPVSASDWQLVPLVNGDGDRARAVVDASLYSPATDRLYFTEEREPGNPGMRVCSLSIDW